MSRVRSTASRSRFVRLARTAGPKKQKVGLHGVAAPDDEDEDEEDGELAVDPGLEKVNPKVWKVAKVADGDCSARLSLIDPAKNSDKYYILQLLDAKGDFYV